MKQCDLNTKLIDAKLYKEDGKYYLTLVYEYSDSQGIYKRTFPKVSLPIESPVQCIHKFYNDTLRINEIILEFPSFDLKVMPKSELDKALYTEEIIEEFSHEMTIEEIEKELGYKIKIIGE